MRRRLRKKRRLAEFTQLGFNLRYSVRENLSSEALDDLLDRFILEAIEANGLFCGGGGGPKEWHFFAYPQGRRSATEADARHVGEWLSGQEAISAFSLGSFEDLWNGAEDAPEVASEQHAA